MKSLKPYIIEMLIFVVCITLLLVGFLVCGYISVKWNLLTIAGILLLSLILLWCFFVVFRRGILALVDAIFRLITTDQVKIINVFPVQASTFSDKAVECYVFKAEQRYIYALKTKRGRILSVISNVYTEYEKNTIYTVQYSKFSKILIRMYKD